MEEGWGSFLDNLRLYLTHFTGQPSATISATGGSPAPKQEAMRALKAALGLNGAAVGSRVESDSPALAGVVERSTDHELMVRTERPASALAGVGVYEWDGKTMTSYRGRSYGDDAQAVAAAQQPVWQAWMDEHFPAPA